MDALEGVVANTNWGLLNRQCSVLRAIKDDALVAVDAFGEDGVSLAVDGVIDLITGIYRAAIRDGLLVDPQGKEGG